MARQSTTPVAFNKSVRKDTAVLMSSARAGVVVPAGYFPVLPGDSAAGSVGIDVALKEMPKPLLNAVHANVQAWFVPKSADPRMSGRDELMHAMTGEKIKALAQTDRDPPSYFVGVGGSNAAAIAGSEMFTTLGLHLATNTDINSEIVDAFNLIYNFRLAAHSSRLTRRPYVQENIAQATTLPPAFWPSSRLSRVVPDYERALIVGSLDLDVIQGRLPVTGIGKGIAEPNPTAQVNNNVRETTGHIAAYPGSVQMSGGDLGYYRMRLGDQFAPDLWAEMQGETIGVSLADIDKARTTQSFAKLRTAYAGNDATGFDNDDTIVALLMQGIPVTADAFKRPILLDSKRVPIGFAERHATDAANLDQSVTVGRASAQLSVNVPMTDVGGVVIFTIEVLPERVDERMADEWLHAKEFADLPNALRDIQRVEPVDMVTNRRVDAKHSTPNGLYGYEPMNDKWNRDFTRLGGDFYQATPGAGWTENRSNIWQTEIVNPTFSTTHYLAPTPFPHNVFADANADAFEFVCRHSVSIVGLTQIGDVLAENNDDYEAIEDAGSRI